MKLLLVVVPDQVELPHIEGTLVSASHFTSASPTPNEVQTACKHLSDVVARQLCLSLEPRAVG